MEPLSQGTASNQSQHTTAGAGQSPFENAPVLGILTPLLGMFGPSLDATKLTTIAIICRFLWDYLSEAFDCIWIAIKSYIWSSIEIRNEDYEVHEQFMAWMSVQNFSKSSRSLLVTMTPDRWSPDEDDRIPDGDIDEFTYTPRGGWHWFWHKRTLVFLHRWVDDRRDLYGFTPENFVLYTFGRSTTALKSILKEARQMHLKKDATKTIVYRDSSRVGGGEGGWKRCYARCQRPLSTVVLDQKQKDSVVDDVRDYLSPTTARWYTYRGIPYRRGYLLYGPPGTGKSSLSFSVAGLFGLRIYVINLASPALTEDKLATLFSTLPTKCIVLLEDIDAAFVDRRKKPSAKSDEPTKGDDDKDKSKPDEDSKVSFSGLLNAIDGVASQEGRILIMTTNHIEKLDPALIRPGRVDMKIEFQLASTEVVYELFQRMFEVFPDEEDEMAENEKRVPPEEIPAMAKEFSERMPGGEFSPAEVQGYLLHHKRQPKEAVNGVPAWVKEQRERREKERQKKEKEDSEAKEAEEREAKEKKEAEEKEAQEKAKKEGAEKSKEKSINGVAEDKTPNAPKVNDADTKDGANANSTN